MKTTYDIHFNDATDSNSCGFSMSLTEARNWIAAYNGTAHSYFNGYPGGTVSIVCNDTGETIEIHDIIN